MVHHQDSHPQVDDTGKSALDYAREAKQHSTWLMLSQSQQERSAKESRRQLVIWEAPTGWYSFFDSWLLY